MVTAKLISAFVFAIQIVQSLYSLHLKFQASSHLLWLYRPVCVGPCRKLRRQVFSQRGSNGIGQQFSLSKPSTLDIAVQCCALSGLCACLTKGFFCLLFVLFEPRPEETCRWGFLPGLRSDTNWAVQSQTLARGLKFVF